VARSLPWGASEAKGRLGLGWGCQERERVNLSIGRVLFSCAPRTGLPSVGLGKTVRVSLREAFMGWIAREEKSLFVVFWHSSGWW